MMSTSTETETRPAPVSLGTMDDVFDRYVQPIYRFLYGRVGNREDAEYLTSETFLKAAKELDVRRSEVSVAAWLFTVARTVLADHWRRYYRYGALVPFEDDLAPSDFEPAGAGTPSNGAEQRVTEILATLPERYRIVLELRFLRGLTVRETAHEMGVTPENVKVLQHRALARALVQCDGRRP